MEMKWHPIEDGNMEELNRSAQYIFTVEIIPMEGKPRRLVTIGEPYEMSCMKFIHPDVREVEYKAWAELPEPYKPTPDKCFKCNHGHLQHDEDSDNWFECELLQRDVPPNGKPEDCPLDR